MTSVPSTTSSRRAKAASGLHRLEGGERALIAAIRFPNTQDRRWWIAAGHRRRDCAILRPQAGHEVVVTTDLSLEGVHFRRDWHPAESVGHRCPGAGTERPGGHGREAAGSVSVDCRAARVDRSS